MSEDSSKNQWQTITNGAPAAPDFWKTGFLPQPNRRPFNASEIGTFIDQLGTVDVLSWAEEPDDDASLQALMAKQWHYV